MRSWRSWPPRAWALLGALVLFSVAVLSVLYWAQFTGRAGTQRGLVIHNDLERDLVVEVVGVERQNIDAGHEETFVLKREQFPTVIIWSERGSGVHDAQTFAYSDVTSAEFRLSIDEQGIHPTTAYRDTPVPATPTPEVEIVIHNDLDRVDVHVAVGKDGREIQFGTAETFAVNREDFPVYVYAIQQELFYDSFGRYVRGREFDYDELVNAEFHVSIDWEEGILPLASHDKKPTPYQETP